MLVLKIMKLYNFSFYLLIAINLNFGIGKSINKYNNFPKEEKKLALGY